MPSATSPAADTALQQTLETVVHVAAEGNCASAAKRLADQLTAQLGAEHVAIACPTGNSGACHLAAVSNVPQVDMRTQWSQQLATLATHAVAQGTVVVWLDDQRGLISGWPIETLAAIVMRSATGELACVALVAWSMVRDRRELEPLLKLLAQALGPIVALQRRSASQPLSERVQAAFRRGAKSGYLWLGAALMLAASVIRYPHTITAEVTLEPIEHRFVSAPFDGVFEQSLVLPGDRVEPGQVLGRMDGRELRTKLAAVEADHARVSRSRDMNLAAGKLAAAQIDRLEMERLEHERALLERRSQQLDIRAPLGGVVVSGDLRKHVGAAMTVGQMLFEVAPLEVLIAQVAIPEQEIELAVLDAPLQLTLDGVTHRSYSGRLERIHPRAEVRDERQVFLGEMRVANDTHTLRPGMHGRARITGPSAPLVWVWLRKPYLACCSCLGW